MASKNVFKDSCRAALFCSLILKFLCVFVVIGGRDDRQHRLPGPFPAQCVGDFPPENLSALYPAASSRQRHHPGHTAHAHQQQFKGMTNMCVCVMEPHGALHELSSVGGEWAEI